MLSNKWEPQKIYKQIETRRDFSKGRRVYRDHSSGFEAEVIFEDDKVYRIKGNGVNCNIHKHLTKKKIFNVPNDYVLRKYIPSCHR